jgi:hypothetical protein
LNDYPKFKKKYGNVIDSRPLLKESILQFQGRLSERLINLLLNDGFGGYANGLIWTIDPLSYKNTIMHWLALGGNGVPFLRTCFGDILVWDDKSIKPVLKLIDIRHCKKLILPGNIDELFDEEFEDYDYFLYWLKAEEFPAIYEKLGPLKHDECYGYEPVLALGGDEIIDNLKIVKFDVHLNIITQLLDGPVD